MLSHISARWTLGLVVGLVAVGLLAASALAQTPTPTPAAKATPTPAKTGNAGLVGSGVGTSAALIALLAVGAGGVVIGGRALARRRG